MCFEKLHIENILFIKSGLAIDMQVADLRPYMLSLVLNQLYTTTSEWSGGGAKSFC